MPHFGAARNLVPVHVLDVDIVVRTCDLFDQLDRLLAGCAPGAEDFNFPSLPHDPLLLFLPDGPKAMGLDCGIRLDHNLFIRLGFKN